MYIFFPIVLYWQTLHPLGLPCFALSSIEESSKVFPILILHFKMKMLHAEVEEHSLL